MRRLVAICLVVTFWSVGSWAAEPCEQSDRFVLLVHGGAGAGRDTGDSQKAKVRILRDVLRQAARILRQGGTALDAVEFSIAALEDAPIFNAGRGGIPNKAGFVELDASIMAGRNLDAGAVAAVRTIRNPIRAARAAMEKSDHVLFVDRGAVDFARSVGLEMADPSYFLVKERPRKGSKSGTVGAVALDRCGDLAAGTSTGGYNSKTPGRVGDSPIIGAGTYANNETCAVSATGWGEYFIRWSAAHDVSALIEYKGLSVKQASSEVLRKIKTAGATGGLIVLDRKGNMAWPYTSTGMIRGYVTHQGTPKIGIMQEMR